jgi:type IV secretion system protein VirB10
MVGAGLLILWTASERGKAVAQKAEDHGGSAHDYALAVAGDKVGYVAPAHAATTPPPQPAVTASPEPAQAATPAPNEELEARKKAFASALFARSTINDPTIQQISNARSQAISAASAAKVVQADPNNLGGSTPAEVTSYERQAGAIPPNPNSLNTYNGYGDRWTLNTHLEEPVTPYILRTGAVIPGLLLSAMESELPGTIIAQVSQDVYDTPTGNYLLIPQGSRLIGEYSNAIQYGQARVFVAWQRIIYPDGSALDIGAMPGNDQQGEAGFRDQVNNHFLRIFSSALLMSAITGGIAYSQSQGNNNNNEFQNPSFSSVLSQAVGQQLGQATAALLERNLSIAPTLNIRPGYRFNILVVKDLTFVRPYVVRDY